jgi:energy-coupling factor transporter ATP-binding protein EcfA2
MNKEQKSKLKEVLPNPIKESFVMLIAGRRGSGKTTLCTRLLLTLNAFKGKFDKIILISPTAHLTSQWKVLDMSKWDVYTEYDPEIIKELLAEQSRSSLWRLGQERPKVLVICDDMGSQLRKVKRSETDYIDVLACNGRHVDVSLIQMAQVYTQFLPSVRSNADIIISYALNSHRDMLALWTECGGTCDYKAFRDHVCAVTDKRYDFVLVKNHGGRLKYHHCFTEITLSEK